MRLQRWVRSPKAKFLHPFFVRHLKFMAHRLHNPHVIGTAWLLLFSFFLLLPSFFVFFSPSSSFYRVGLGAHSSKLKASKTTFRAQIFPVFVSTVPARTTTILSMCIFSPLQASGDSIRTAPHGILAIIPGASMPHIWSRNRSYP